MDDHLYRGVLHEAEESPYFKGAEVEPKTYPLKDENQARLQRDFVYRAPKPDQIPRYETIRNDARDFAQLLMTLCPPSRELSLALTDLEMCVAHANMSIARNE